MDLNTLKFTDGYIGAMGSLYSTPTTDELEGIIEKAMAFNDSTRDEIMSMINSGQKVKWCKSPNYYYDHSYGVIKLKTEAPKPEMVECDCGHAVLRGSVMSASIGSSCPNCYDQMSY